MLIPYTHCILFSIHVLYTGKRVTVLTVERVSIISSVFRTRLVIPIRIGTFCNNIIICYTVQMNHQIGRDQIDFYFQLDFVLFCLKQVPGTWEYALWLHRLRSLLLQRIFTMRTYYNVLICVVNYFMEYIITRATAIMSYETGVFFFS